MSHPAPDPYSLIPDSAPFNAEQRAWLNGFLAGVMGVQGAAAAAPAVPALEEPAADDHPWHDESLALDERMELAEGRPLQDKLMAAMAQLDCGSCGYLCHSYAEAIATGADTDLTKCVPGEKPTSKMLKTLMRDAKASGGEAKVVEAVTVNGAAQSGWTRQNPYPATLRESRCLNGPGSAKDVRHVVIDLGDSGLTYAAGDALGVFPHNCPELVDLLIDTMAATGDEPTGRGTLREALTDGCNLKDVDEDVIAVLLNANANGDTAALKALAEDDGRMEDMDLLDVLLSFPRVRPDPAALVDALSPLQPRLYSIASSPDAHPGEVHLTVGKATTLKRDRLRRGAASCMFAERMTAGDTVKVFVQKAHAFAPPADGGRDVIMVGPGTGIAPFRAFLEHREATAAPGRNWLFFGDQKSDCDFLYRDELEGRRDRGVLHRLDLAFSRDSAEKVYVQHRMEQAADELYDWLKGGAHFYICGDASRMAKDVDATLRKIAEARGEDGAAFVKRLAAEGRYQKDVY